MQCTYIRLSKGLEESPSNSSRTRPFAVCFSSVVFPSSCTLDLRKKDSSDATGIKNNEEGAYRKSSCLVKFRRGLNVKVFR